MSTYNIVASTEDSTVVAEYVSAYASGYKRADAYQSEAELEREFIHLYLRYSIVVYSANVLPTK